MMTVYTKYSNTHKHMIHAVVPAFSKRHKFGVVINSLMSAKLARIAVQHYLVTVAELRSRRSTNFLCNSENLRKESEIT